MCIVLVDHWPLTGLSLTVSDLVLRWPTGEELASLGEVAAEGVHEPGYMPFLHPWTDVEPAELARTVILHFWRRAGMWTAKEWQLNFVVFQGEQPVGVQTIGGDDFAVTREVSTGSWLGRRFQGQGIGTRMRAAVLDLAFTGLGAQCAVSSAFMDNQSSLAVSRKLGYRDDGIARHDLKGELRIDQRLRLDRRDWSGLYPVQTDGLEACLPLFGL